MFKSLREKFTSWFKSSGQEEKKPKKAKTKEKVKSANAEKKAKTVKPAEKLIEKPVKKSSIEEIEKKLEKVEEELKKETSPLEKPKTFLQKIFGKKEQVESVQEKKIETPQETKVEPEEPIEESSEKQGFFSKLASKLSTSTLTQEQFDSMFQDLEMTLLENNVALEVVEKIHDELAKDLVGIEVKKAKIQETIIKSLKESISQILIEPPDLLEKINKKISSPFTIIFVGINGSGKTTSIAKLAHYLKKNNITCLLAAADTFRAASIEQLEKHAEKLKVPIIKHQYGSDPAAVAFDAIKYAESHKIKAVLIDTAGRMYTKINLIKEMEKIVRVSKPDLKIFVGESITGNDATEQAKTFNEAINIDGIILTKADVDEKAGAILSVSYVTKKPIFFLGTGQEYSDFTPFTKKEVVKNLGLE